MKSRLKITSTILLFAVLFSLVPALALPSSVSAATCDWVQFIADVTVPDGTNFTPGLPFKKTWRLKNIGTCTWTTAYSLVFDSGAQMGAPASVPFPSNVAPGQTIDINVDMTAPSTSGHYIGYWKFKNAAGVLFGIGAYANKSWWVDIDVIGSDAIDVVYDFNVNASYATWTSGAGGLPFPGSDGDARGFVIKQDTQKFESGVTSTKPGLLLAPQNISNGFIQGKYPSFKVQSGDRFLATVGCEYGATYCYVTYRLDYEDAGVIKTFWTFRERYEGWTYNVNLDLSPLAGKEVKFVIYINSYGSPSGDRALLGTPIIVRKGIVPPPPTVTGTPPTATPSKTPGPITPTVPPSTCDKVQFIADVTIPDGTVMLPGQAFTKTWRLKNIGGCTWTTSYQLVFFSGEKMGAASSANFTKNVAYGETVDVSMNMVAPTAPGSYRGYWMFKNANGALFGIGSQSNKPWWVDIKVTSGPTVTPGVPSATPTQGGPTLTPLPTSTPLANTAYDFYANACAASWYSGAGVLPCPGQNGDAKGFVLKQSNPILENGTTDTRGGLLTYPQNVQDGYIQGFYPAFKVQSGDRFQSTINCEYGATNCYVVFRLDYQTGSDPIKTFWGPFLERNEGGVFNVDIDLTPLAGKDVKFILTILAAGSPTGDRALWAGPRIYRAGASASTAPQATNTPIPPASATPASSSSTADWEKYYNQKYGFEFKYPKGSVVSNQTETHARINLQITPGTTLMEKFADVTVQPGATTCKSPDIGGTATKTETVTINGIQFFKETGSGAAAGNIYDFVAYSSSSNSNCVSLTFVLHSGNASMYPTPPPAYDKAAESVVFDQMINTFDWTG